MPSYNKAGSKRKRIESSYESGDFSKKFKHEVKKQAELAGEDFFSQLLGFEGNDNANAPAKSPDGNVIPFPGQETSVKKEKPKASKKGVIFDIKDQLLGNNFLLMSQPERRATNENAPRREAAIEYHSEFNRGVMRAGENLSRRESGEQNSRSQQILAELRKLASSMKELQREFGHVTVDQAPSNTGTYYVNFFEWMLIMIRQARQKVEDSKSWLETLKGKSQKKGYWGMAKKGGTSFTQSNERSMATSTG